MYCIPLLFSCTSLYPYTWKNKFNMCVLQLYKRQIINGCVLLWKLSSLTELKTWKITCVVSSIESVNNLKIKSYRYTFIFIWGLSWHKIHPNACSEHELAKYVETKPNMRWWTYRARMCVENIILYTSVTFFWKNRQIDREKLSTKVKRIIDISIHEVLHCVKLIRIEWDIKWGTSSWIEKTISLLTIY